MKLFRHVFRWIIWNLFSRPFVKIYVKRLYNYKIASGYKGFPKPPFVVIANHGTFFDPWIVGGFSRYPFSFMVNDDGFRGKSLSSWYLKSIDAIPKKKGASDFKAMKTTMGYLHEKRVVCIFPEGQTTWDGETQLLYKGIEKIIKKVRCPLVMVKLQGNFLTKPWWANTIRKGKIRLHFKTLNHNDIDNLSSDQLFEVIKSYIYQNDIKDSDNQNYSFSGTKMAEGLERFVWICMNCGSEDTLHTENNTIGCSSCKSSWDIDAYCRLKPHDQSANCVQDLKDWADMHTTRVKKFLSERTGVLTFNENITIQTENSDHLFENKENGKLVLTREELTFEGNSGTRVWPLAELEDYVIQKKDVFEIRHKDNYYRFVFNKQSPMKWIYYFRYLKNYTIYEQQGHF